MNLCMIIYEFIYDHVWLKTHMIFISWFDIFQDTYTHIFFCREVKSTYNYLRGYLFIGFSATLTQARGIWEVEATIETMLHKTDV